MGKKIVKINGKKYLVDDETKQMEEVEEEGEPEEGGEGTDEEAGEGTGEGTGSEEEEGGEEEKIDEAAEKIVKSLGIEDLRKQVQDLNEQAKKDKDSKSAEVLNLEKMMKKDVTEMTSREKITGFFQGMVQSNDVVMKALSEGTSADGGYLFPDEFRDEVIRDIAEEPHMRKNCVLAYS